MFILGLLLPICFVSGYTGVTIPTQWVLLSCVLPFSLWKSAKFTLFHWLGVGFLAYACASLLWTTNIDGAVFGLWRCAIWALAFWYGTVSVTLSPLWRGLAVGLSLSTLVAIAQAFGFHSVLSGESQTAGLLFNNTVAGAAIALVLIALACESAWHYMPMLIAGLALAQSRGSILVIGVALLSKYVHWLVALATLAAGAFAFSLHEIPNDAWRLQIWGYAIRGLTFFGWGPDAFNDVYYVIHNADLHPSFAHPEFVHNDYLQLWFSFGIAALIPYTIFGYAATRTRHIFWPVMVGFGTLGTFWFPLYTPITAFIGYVLAGHLCRGFDLVRLISNIRGFTFVEWLRNGEPNEIINRRGCVSMERIHSQSEA